MKTIIGYAEKGGVGKTFFNIALSYELAKANNVLLIDADCQSNASKKVCSRDILNNNISLIDGLIHDLSIEDIIIKAPIKDKSNLDFIKCENRLIELEDVVFKSKNPKMFFLEYMQRNLEQLNKYDYIIIDLGPTFSTIALNFLLIADSLVLIAEDNNIDSIDGISDFLKHYAEYMELIGVESAKTAVLMNKVRNMKSNTKELFNQILKKYPTVSGMLLDAQIHETTVVKAALMRKESVTDYAKKTRGNSKSRGRLFEEMTNLMNELKEKGLV